MFKNSCTIFTHSISNIIYIIVHCVLLLFIIINMILISIKLPKTNLAFYLIFFFLTIILIILGGILFCYVQRKTHEIQPKIKILTILALIITILFLVLTIVEEVIISIDYSKMQSNKCITDKIDPYGIVFKKNNLEINTISNLKRVLSGEDVIKNCFDSYLFKTVKKYSYFTLTLIEIISIISIIYWIQNKKKHADQPIQIPQMINNVRTATVQPSSVVVQPSPVVVQPSSAVLQASPVVVQPSSVVIKQIPINNGNIVIPGQQIYSNYYPQQSNILYSNGQIIYNNNYPSQQYVLNNNNIGQNNVYGNKTTSYVINNNNNNNNNVNSSDRQVYI